MRLTNFVSEFNNCDLLKFLFAGDAHSRSGAAGSETSPFIGGWRGQSGGSGQTSQAQSEDLPFPQDVNHESWV